MYTLLREDQPPTRVLVMHLRGWIDAGSAAAMAMDAIAGQLELEPLASASSSATSFSKASAAPP